MGAGNSIVAFDQQPPAHRYPEPPDLTDSSTRTEIPPYQARHSFRHPHGRAFEPGDLVDGDRDGVGVAATDAQPRTTPGPRRPRAAVARLLKPCCGLRERLHSSSGVVDVIDQPRRDGIEVAGDGVGLFAEVGEHGARAEVPTVVHIGRGGQTRTGHRRVAPEIAAPAAIELIAVEPVAVELLEVELLGEGLNLRVDSTERIRSN